MLTPLLVSMALAANAPLVSACKGADAVELTEAHVVRGGESSPATLCAVTHRKDPKGDTWVLDFNQAYDWVVGTQGDQFSASAGPEADLGCKAAEATIDAKRLGELADATKKLDKPVLLATCAGSGPKGMKGDFKLMVAPVLEPRVARVQGKVGDMDYAILANAVTPGADELRLEGRGRVCAHGAGHHCDAKDDLVLKKKGDKWVADTGDAQLNGWLTPCALSDKGVDALKRIVQPAKAN